MHLIDIQQQSIFTLDINDHCAVAIVRNAKLPKTKHRIIIRQSMSQFREQGFVHDLAQLDWEKI